LERNPCRPTLNAFAAAAYARASAIFGDGVGVFTHAGKAFGLGDCR
jgi:hypothetical protein